MDRWIWVIPVIALGVWVITQVIRSSNEVKKVPERRGPQPRRSSTSDIDRFLEEINRRRQQQQQMEREQADAPVVQPVAPPPPPPPPVQARPQRQRTSSRQKYPGYAPPPVRRRPATVVVEPVGPRSAAEPIVIAEVIAPEVGSAGLSFQPVPEIRTPKAPRHIEQLRQLLSRDGLRAAVLLNEILGPPRSKRR